MQPGCRKGKIGPEGQLSAPVKTKMPSSAPPPTATESTAPQRQQSLPGWEGEGAAHLPPHTSPWSIFPTFSSAHSAAPPPAHNPAPAALGSGMQRGAVCPRWQKSLGSGRTCHQGQCKIQSHTRHTHAPYTPRHNWSTQRLVAGHHPHLPMQGSAGWQRVGGRQ